MSKGTIGHISGNPGVGIGLAMALIMAAKKSARTRRVDVVATPAQQAARTVRNERDEWNAAVDAKKAAKKAAK